MLMLKLLFSLKTRGFPQQRRWLTRFKVMEVMDYLTETNGHLFETLMETEITSRLVLPIYGHQEILTRKIVVDGQLGEIQQVVEVFAQYLVMINNMRILELLLPISLCLNLLLINNQYVNFLQIIEN